MNLFNQRKNKGFNYKPKFQEHKEHNTEKDITSKWQEIKRSRKHKSKKGGQIVRWLVLLIMIIVLWYVLSNYEM